MGRNRAGDWDRFDNEDRVGDREGDRNSDGYDEGDDGDFDDVDCDGDSDGDRDVDGDCYLNFHSMILNTHNFPLKQIVGCPFLPSAIFTK